MKKLTESSIERIEEYVKNDFKGLKLIERGDSRVVYRVDNVEFEGEAELSSVVLKHNTGLVDQNIVEEQVSNLCLKFLKGDLGGKPTSQLLIENDSCCAGDTMKKALEWLKKHPEFEVRSEDAEDNPIAAILEDLNEEEKEHTKEFHNMIAIVLHRCIENDRVIVQEYIGGENSKEYEIEKYKDVFNTFAKVFGIEDCTEVLSERNTINGVIVDYGVNNKNIGDLRPYSSTQEEDE